MAEQGPLSGQKLGEKYLLGELLGQGGFGAVYKAQHLLLNRPQAIKVLLEQHFGSARFRERFIREAQTLAALDHANILPVHDFGIEGSRAYLVMPFISGGTLQGVLKARPGPLGLDETARYLAQICAALDYAHKRGVVHLDLKPLNLLLHEDGRLLLSDFGLAHLMEQGAVEGGTSLQFGSPVYMAPEHFDGHPEQRSDLYALGIILYQLLAGRLPFTASSPLALMRQHLTEAPPPLRAARPDLPPALDAVLNKALAKQPAQRYQTAGELLYDFRAAMAGRLSQPVGGASTVFYAQTRVSQPQQGTTVRAANLPGSPQVPGAGPYRPTPSGQPGARPTAGQYVPPTAIPGAPAGMAARPPAGATAKKATFWTPGFSWLFLGVVVFEVILLALLAANNPSPSSSVLDQPNYHNYPYFFSFYAAYGYDTLHNQYEYISTPGFASLTSKNTIMILWVLLLVICLVGIASVRSWWIRLGFVFQVASVLIASVLYQITLNAASEENLVLALIACLVIFTHLSVFCIFYALVRLALSGPRSPGLGGWYRVGDSLYQTFVQPLPAALQAIFKLLGVILRCIIMLLTLPPFFLLWPSILYNPALVRYIGSSLLLMTGWYVLFCSYYVFNPDKWVYYAAFLYPTLCCILAFLLLIQTERLRKKAVMAEIEEKIRSQEEKLGQR